MEIDATRASTPTIIHALSNVRTRRAATVKIDVNIDNNIDGARRGYTAISNATRQHWRQCCACIEALPADQPERVWRIALVEIVALRRWMGHRRVTEAKNGYKIRPSKSQ